MKKPFFQKEDAELAQIREHTDQPQSANRGRQSPIRASLRQTIPNSSQYRIPSRSKRKTLEAPEAHRLVDEQSPSLSPLMTKFVQFDVKQYASIATFCANNGAIFEEDTRHLQPFVQHLLRQGNTALAQQVAHKMIVLHKCSGLNPAQKMQYLRNLHSSGEKQDEVEQLTDAHVRFLKS